MAKKKNKTAAAPKKTTAAPKAPKKTTAAPAGTVATQILTHADLVKGRKAGTHHDC